jgi:hypothetical protein
VLIKQFGKRRVLKIKTAAKIRPSAGAGEEF